MAIFIRKFGLYSPASQGTGWNSCCMKSVSQILSGIRRLARRLPYAMAAFVKSKISVTQEVL